LALTALGYVGMYETFCCEKYHTNQELEILSSVKKNKTSCLSFLCALAKFTWVVESHLVQKWCYKITKS